MKWSEWKITERGINAPGMKELQFENRKAVIKNLGGCIGGSFMQGFLVLYENDIQVAKKHYLNIFIYR
ncbi:MAG: hypothetical protein WCO51_12565, partial [bacterium]